MEKLLTDFGVQPMYLAAQAVNFFILFLILKKFLYVPILKILDHRRQAAEKTLDNEKKIDQKLQAAEQESDLRINEASRQAKMIVEQATCRAERIISAANMQAEADLEHMLEKGRQTLAEERKIMLKEVHEKLSGLVVLGIENLTGKLLDSNDQRVIVDRTINNIREGVQNKK